MLGHRTIVSTQIYASVTIRKLKEIHAAKHPSEVARPEVEAEAKESPEDADTADTGDIAA